jgi:thioredoxin-related protein
LLIGTFVPSLFGQKPLYSFPQSITGIVRRLAGDNLQVAVNKATPLRLKSGTTLQFEQNTVISFTLSRARISRDVRPANVDDLRPGSAVGVSFEDPEDVFTPITALSVYVYPVSSNESLNGAISAPAQIQWNSQLFDAFKVALKTKKPLIVFFRESGCPWCQKMESETLKSALINSLADQAVFAVISQADEDSKGNVSKLMQDLQIERLPTTSVLDVSANMIVERDRIVGYFDAQNFYSRLTAILHKTRGAQ